jgi:hypothetical protein
VVISSQPPDELVGAYEVAAAAANGLLSAAEAKVSELVARKKEMKLSISRYETNGID